MVATTPLLPTVLPSNPPPAEALQRASPAQTSLC